MILSDKYKRVVLWGVEFGMGDLIAGLAYFGGNLNTPTIWVNSQDNKQRIKLRLPNEVRGNDGPSKAQNITLDICTD